MKLRLLWYITLVTCTLVATKAQNTATIVANYSDTLSWAASGGVFFLPVEAVTTKDWKVEIRDSSDWVHTEKKDSTGFLVTMKPNETGTDRYATMRLFSNEKERNSVFLQLGNKRIVGGYAYGYPEQRLWLPTFPEWGENWTVKVNSEASNWARAVRHGNEVIMLWVGKNTGREKRMLSLIVQDGEKELPIFLVVQHPNPLPLSDHDYRVGNNASIITLEAGITDSLVFELPDWISVHSKQKKDEGMRYELAVQANLTDVARYDSIRVCTEAKTGQTEIAISQYGHSPYTPLEAETLYDIPVTIASGEASSFQSGEGIERSFDGDPATIYHSLYYHPEHDVPNDFPITLTYKFQKPETLNYLEYHPRTDGGTNGLFREVDILVQTAGKETFKLIKSADFRESRLTKRIDFPNTQKNVIAVRLVVKSGMGEGYGFASCAEMKFYRTANLDFRYTDLFTDSTCSTLKPGISERTIKRCRQPFFRNLAMHMLRGDYPREFRIQDYKAWESPDDQAKKNGTMPFSLFDNPTGMAAVANEPLVLFVGNEAPEGLALTIQNLSVTTDNDGYGGQSYLLHKGLNVIRPITSGLIYILYQSETPQSMPPVCIHFATGRVNGYFDSAKHILPDGTSRWNELLARAGDKFFDVLSDHVHFTFRAEDFRRYVPNVSKLLAAYDTLICHEQEFEGLRKYNRWMKNRLYIHTTYREMLYATPYHIGFQEAQLPPLLCPDSLMGAYCWGPAHELGHVLQIAPSMTWTAMMEVTNNIQSMEIQRLWGNPSRLHTESRRMNGYKDIYEQAMNVAFVQQRPFTYLSDWFDQLVPFWQLRLYVMDVCGKNDFYKDVYEASRQPNVLDAHLTSGQLQLEFIYNSCVSAEMDLRPFFSKWGWLQPTERIYDDYYGKDTIVVTPTDVEKLNIRIDSLRLPVPSHAAEYITDNTLHLYTHPQPFLPGTIQINAETGDVTVKDFSGAVAFEVFQEEKLIGVSYQPEFKIPALRGVNTSNVHVKAVSPERKRMICKEPIKEHTTYREASSKISKLKPKK